MRLMGLVKTEKFTIEQNRMAELARALGHPARIAILQYLLSKQTCVCGDIVEELPLSQSTVSQHLAELKKAGIIQGEIDGPRVCYCINPEVWDEVNVTFKGFFDSLSDGPDCC